MFARLVDVLIRSAISTVDLFPVNDGKIFNWDMKLKLNSAAMLISQLPQLKVLQKYYI